MTLDLLFSNTDPQGSQDQSRPLSSKLPKDLDLFNDRSLHHHGVAGCFERPTATTMRNKHSMSMELTGSLMLAFSVPW